MVWNDNVMEGAGRARFDHFWRKSSWVGRGNLDKIDQCIKLYYFSANVQNKIKSFDTFIDHPVAEVLLRECFV